MANKKYKLTDGNMWATDGIHDFGQNKTQRTINSEVNTALGGKAPTNHASTSTTYGKGTSSNYGHVKISDSLTDTTPAATGGVVPSMKAVSDLNGAITSLSSVLNVSQLSDLSGGANHFVTFTASVVVGGVTIPQHSKGVLTASSANDATLYVIDTQGNVYTAFRNNGTWKVGNKKTTQITNADMQNNWQTNGLCYLMRTNDEIHLHAGIRNGTTTDGTVILSFPDYKPIVAINTPIFNVVNKTLNGYALASENGNISIYGVTNASYAIFDLFWTI